MGISCNSISWLKKSIISSFYCLGNISLIMSFCLFASLICSFGSNQSRCWLPLNSLNSNPKMTFSVHKSRILIRIFYLKLISRNQNVSSSQDKYIFILLYFIFFENWYRLDLPSDCPLYTSILNITYCEFLDSHPALLFGYPQAFSIHKTRAHLWVGVFSRPFPKFTNCFLILSLK